MARPHTIPLLAALLAALASAPGGGVRAGEEPPGRPIRLLSETSLSPDGRRLVFARRGDLWTAPTEGGRARRLTAHPGRDGQPRVGPRGDRVAFVSNRSGSDQVWVMPLAGGVPRRVTDHTEGFRLLDWYPDGRAVLVSAHLDHAWRHGRRLFRRPLDEEGGLELVFDAAARDARLSPDGRRIAFTREGASTWRKGYRGSQASQVWLHDLQGGTFRKLTVGDHGERSPRWAPDGRRLYVTSQEDGAFDLVEIDLESGSRRALTRYPDDGVHAPVVSADGRTIVFRRLFDLWRLRVGTDAAPERIRIVDAGDAIQDPLLHRTLKKAEEVAFTDDAREIAFTAGGDVWVMDTELREPRRVTDTPEEERSPLFSPDFETLYFTSDVGGRTDIWSATREDESRHWWQNDAFRLAKLTDDDAAESHLSFVPGGERIAYVKGLGDLVTAKPDGSDVVRLVASWHPPRYSFSPDGTWVAYAVQDEAFNVDVWIRRSDGRGEPFNVSRHPDDDSNPAWSPDGRILAFTGERTRQERDVCYVWLRKADEERQRRDLAFEKAIEKMKGRKGRKGKKKPAKKKPMKAMGAMGTWTGRIEGDAPIPPQGVEISLVLHRDASGGWSASLTLPGVFEGAPDTLRVDGSSVALAATTALGNLEAQAAIEGGRMEGTWSIEGLAAGTLVLDRKGPEAPRSEGLRIDFEGLADRIHRIAIPNTSEYGLLWSPDSKRLAFQATVDGSRGTYTVAFPDDLRPRRLTSKVGTSGRWLKEGNQIAWLVDGVPGLLSASGKARSFGFEVRQVVDRAARNAAAFDQIWRRMRDTFYDARLNDLDWEAVCAKYRDVAAASTTPEDLEEVVRMMLGELNGSHLGFSAKRDRWSRPGWREVTGHLGVRFDGAFEGPGLRIRDVIRGTPAHEEDHRLHPGDVVLAIDGAPATRANVHRLLTGEEGREVELRVQRIDGETCALRLRPTTYRRVRTRLYDEWLRAHRETTERLSEGRIGYLHVRSMNWSSFDRFVTENYKAGHGKDGLIIDVRDNGGGFTADHLLTVLTLPQHARTVPRGGRPGYPEDRLVYARWWRPIVVLCNQNSFSNAEIFAHAIKTLDRGEVVGVPTAGGVISTGRTSIMDVGSLRLPYRGWFVLTTGEDMERAGCVPDHVVWPTPGDEVAGVDRQLMKAVEVMRTAIEQARRRAAPPPRYASERDDR